MDVATLAQLEHENMIEADAAVASQVTGTNINAAWPDGGPTHPDVAWCREYFAAMTPNATGGVYVNFLHNDEGEARSRAAYGTSYERLARIKARYDPDNVFRSNQNLKPAVLLGD